MIRRLLPALIWPLAILATGLSAAPWLRTFLLATATVPLFGAALLSVLVALVSVSLTRRSLPVTAAIDLLAFVIYFLVVVLHDPLGFSRFVDGFRQGPADLLSFALPLVGPRSLLVVPVALCWLTGAIVGEILARRPSSPVPIAVWLIGFGVAYAATARAYLEGPATNRVADTVLGAALLATLAALRIAQTWRQRNAGVVSSASAPPLRGLLAGLVITVVAVGAGSIAIQSSSLNGAPSALQRAPSIRLSQPTTPLAFVASLRPNSRTATGATLFSVTLDQATSAYISLASVDYYDGDSWSFDRSFRPSGGVIPADTDAALTGRSATTSQQYQIEDRALAAAPWLPYLARPQKVTGTAVSIDPASGMIVPTDQLRSGDRYQIRSVTSTASLAPLGASWLPATSPPPVDSQLPAALRPTLTQVVAAFAAETGQASTTTAAFLTAVVKDLRTNYRLSDPGATSGSGFGAPATAATPRAPATTGAGGTASPNGTARPTPSGTGSTGPAAGAVSGGTSFAAVLASILGEDRSGKPEQYATLVAVLARAIGVPARVVSGFRLANTNGVAAAGRHEVTANQAHTWVEIPVRGAGWAVFDPSPATYSDSAASNTVGAEPSSSPSATPTNNALVTQASGGHAVAPKSAVAGHGAAHLGWLLLGPALIVALVLVIGLGRLIRGAGRRRRRTTGDPRNRVVGAWNESLDVLQRTGLPNLTGLSGAEVTTATEGRFGVESATAVAVLGTTANRALFSSAAAIAADDADIAWQAHDRLRRAVRKAVPWRTRIAATWRLRRRRS